MLETLQQISLQFSESLRHQAELHNESIKVIASANIEIAKGLGEQAKSFGNWIDSFKVAAVPESRVMNDAAMVELEQKLAGEGFPSKANQKEQMTALTNRFLSFEELEASLLG